MYIFLMWSESSQYKYVFFTEPMSLPNVTRGRARYRVGCIFNSNTVEKWPPSGISPFMGDSGVEQ